MNKIQIAIQIAKLVLFLIFGLRDLVLQAEEQIPESGKGKEKFAAVKAAISASAGFLGIADEAVRAADKIIDTKINDVVTEAINK